jgi:1,2-diacylglycerol 3-alpha-glucosyltransferase
MKVLHICMCGPVSDGWNYQENMLTKYHVKLGNQVTLIAPQWSWGKSGKLEKCERPEYVNADGVKMIRLPIKRDKHIHYRYKKYSGFYQSLENEVPDIIFVHNIQFFDLLQIVKYAKRHPVIVYVDNHSDFSNSARSFLAKTYYKLIWRYVAKKIEPYAKKFYGVLPSRVDFIKDIYRIRPDIVELLEMGADDDEVIKASSSENKKLIRQKYNIAEEDFLIVTGGKIDEFKTQTLLLMKSFSQIEISRIKLLVFGSVVDSLKEELSSLCDGIKVQYIGWINSEESYKYFAAADLVVFPGRHSVFWEQVAGQGIPMICKHWSGTDHVDIGGNVEFLYDDSIDEITFKILDIVNDKTKYQNMKVAAENKGKEVFLYKEIARRAINM